MGEVVFMTGLAGDAMRFHGFTTHVGLVNAAGSQQPRVAQFARYSQREMCEQAPIVMFPDEDGTPWSPSPSSKCKDASQHTGNVAAEQDEHAAPTAFFTSGSPRSDDLSGTMSRGISGNIGRLLSTPDFLCECYLTSSGRVSPDVLPILFTVVFSFSMF